MKFPSENPSEASADEEKNEGKDEGRMKEIQQGTSAQQLETQQV